MTDVPKQRTFRSRNASVTLSEGQEVWLLDNDRRQSSRRTDPEQRRTYKATVVKLGTKYATVQKENTRWEQRFSLPEYDTGGAMVEDTEIGYPEYLFPTFSELQAHARRERLLTWMKTDGDRLLDHASLEQLSAIYEILYPKDDEKKEEAT